MFILPQSVLQEVDKKCREFLWGSSEGHKKIALVAWDKVCVPKKVWRIKYQELQIMEYSCYREAFMAVVKQERCIMGQMGTWDLYEGYR